MSFVSDILGDVDEIRSIRGDLGLCPCAVYVRVTTWSGSYLGQGTKSETDTRITLPGGTNPKVRRVAYKETVAGGGKYQEGDYRIGPFTPDYIGGGLAFSSMVPTGTGDARTGYHWVLVGPDTPTDGMLCEPVQEEADHPLHRYVVVRPHGVTPYPAV